MQVATSFQFTLKQVRELLGLSQQELADRAGVSVGPIIAIEGHADHKTHTQTAHAIARSVGLRIDDIDWPRGLTDLGRPPMTGRPLEPIRYSYVCCPMCFLAHPLNWRPGDECENCS